MNKTTAAVSIKRVGRMNLNRSLNTISLGIRGPNAFSFISLMRCNFISALCVFDRSCVENQILRVVPKYKPEDLAIAERSFRYRRFTY